MMLKSMRETKFSDEDDPMTSARASSSTATCSTSSGRKGWPKDVGSLRRHDREEHGKIRDNRTG